MAPRENERASSAGISLHTASAGDTEFLMSVYASTRQEEMASWGWDPKQQASFIRMQFDVRHRGYLAAYPTAETSLISVGDIPVGSIIIFRGTGEIRLLDIALLPESRGRGIGAELIRMLISEATRSGSPLRLSVRRGNRAAHLYERLGLVARGGDEMYSEMECAPSESQARGNV
jgi:ribosomal protein S18 acetylase RimI-like enzyme